MDSDFDDALDGLCGMVLNFDCNNLTKKEIIPSKARVLTSALFIKSVQVIKVKFDVITRHKTVFWCLHATDAQIFSSGHSY